MGGVAFVLFSFYMITDPMTSPSSLRGQIVFGMSLATAYAVLMVNHVIFTLFYAVFFVTGLRGAVLFVESVLASRRAAVAPSLATGT
jgi:Na+-translocating ferredoxin:NAD+ oxidoreductase RnfD subunit